MEKFRNSFRTVLVASAGFLLIALLFTACKKSSDDNNSAPVAGLMGFNLSPDKDAVGLAISNSRLTNAPLAYSNYTGAYQNIYLGSRVVSAFNYAGSDSAFATATENFEANKYYSVFVVGANGNYRNVIVKDELDSLASTTGLAYVRYINAIPDSSKPAVTLTAAGTDVSSSNTSYATVSAFTGINAGELTVKVSNDSTISANRTITVEKGKVYTILLIGLPGSTDADKKVQVKFITNGTTS
jgi:Domain of unknown function (DUF4397)